MKVFGRFIFTVFTVIAAVNMCEVEAQHEPIDLRGDVRDQHGDAIVGAKVSLVNSQGRSVEVITDDRGRFQVEDLAAGTYTFKVFAEGFASHDEKISLMAGSMPRQIKITLYPSIAETVNIDEDKERVALDPGRASGAQVLKERELKAMPDDPDQFEEHLQLLATSSGSPPGGATVTVDGFLNEGRLPPKSAIREVRINPDLFSAEYDKPPYRGGRIEIYTRPGTTSFHGTGFFNFNDSVMNARDVFAPTRAPSTTRRYGFQFGGPLVRKRAGALFDFEARDIEDSATVNAIILDNDFQPTPLSVNMPTPKLLLIGSIRADWQINSANTFVARYDFNRDRLKNQGVGGFDLPERGYNSRAGGYELRLSETAVLSNRAFNEARLGLALRQITQEASSNAPAISVLGAFSAGGATGQSLIHKEQCLEFAGNLSVSFGKHSLKAGAQIIARRIDDARSDNFNGTFIFGGGVAPKLDSSGSIVADADGATFINVSGLEQYRRTLLGLPGGAPTRFSITKGNPLVSVNHWTMAGFAQDEWRLRRNLLISLGLRYESQNNPSDGVSLAPRLGLAYSPDKEQRWVLRARAGIFYDRISELLTLETRRLDGSHQNQIIVDSPSFPDPFKGGILLNVVPTLRRIDSKLRPPTSLQTQAGFERQMPRGWKLEMSYYWSRGWADLRSRNINAPLFGSGDDPLNAPRPLGVKENLLQFESSGSINGQVLFIGANQSSNKHFNIFSGYLLFDFHSDTDSAFSLPQSSYDFSGERSRPSWQSRHRAFLVCIINLPRSLRASSLFNIASGTPYNITTGRDNNGDGNFNDRPGFIDSGDLNAVQTIFGSLDPAAINGALRRNAGTNPVNATLDLDVSRSFSFGGKGRDNDSGYKLTLNARAGNLLNHANVSGLNGVLTSPFFGRANSAAPSRRIEVGARFSF
ncbi:MAG: TonB-dependent receptor [Blastocatellia bacterium]|nr:TonB-dependent receptor [Blastocatellia bacterium]